MPSTLSPLDRRAGPLVFAHRGGRALGPENTLVAFDLGLAAGADGLELDVHLSRDGVGGKQFSVRLRDLIRRGDISANVEMKPGDILIIPQGFF